MARLKIDYGIDLGTTNSAICRMEKGEPTIKKSDTLKDTMPSCVSFTKKKGIKVGDSAYQTLRSDKRRATKSWTKEASNTFVEFKRTMGSDFEYESKFMERKFNSEELSAEVLKTLKSFVQDEQVTSAVITVPAKFTVSQKDATMRAAKMAGFEHCELLQEPIAASMAYGLTSEQKNGYWMVFDFGGGTFDAALLKVEDGIMQVFDTEGDNFLGGKDLDYAVVDNILLPYLTKNFSIENILSDEDKKESLREALKTYAEDAKIQLSFKPQEDIISNLGDLGEDDEGEGLELDLSITLSQLKEVLTPIYQKSVDICKKLLSRNNMKGDRLSSLILVGGPTFSFIIRDMLKEQITTNVMTNVDPMTVVANGAALYASTIDNEAEQELESGTIAFDIEYESTTVESSVFIPIKLDKKNTNGTLPPSVSVILTRGDKAWSSSKETVNEMGTVIELQLLEGKSNLFVVSAFDDKGKSLNCFPNEINIIQGSKIGSAILPYNIGIEVWNEDNQRGEFNLVKGLEKNKPLPAVGAINGLKTTNVLRPGSSKDFIKIPIYQGDEGAQGLSAVYFEHVYDVIIKGENLPSLLPEGSDVDITIKVDRSESVSMSAYFPSIDYTEEIDVPKDSVQEEVSEAYLKDEIKKGKSDIAKLKEQGVDVTDYEEKISGVSVELDNGNLHKQVLQHLREVLRDVDRNTVESEWTELEKKLRSAFNMLEEDNKKYGDDNTTTQVDEIRGQVDESIRRKDIPAAKQLLEMMSQLNFKLAAVEYFEAWIVDWYKRFSTIQWKDEKRAKMLIGQAAQIMNDNPTADKLVPIVSQLVELLPQGQKPAGAEGLLGH